MKKLINALVIVTALAFITGCGALNTGNGIQNIGGGTQNTAAPIKAAGADAIQPEIKIDTPAQNATAAPTKKATKPTVAQKKAAIYEDAGVPR